MSEYDDLALEYAERVVALLKANAAHQPHLHNLPAAATDAGLSAFCPGCELIVRAKRLHDMASAKDDTRAQKRFGNKSRRDSVFETYVARRQIEEPAAPPIGRRP